MGLCEVVAVLADAVAEHRPNCTKLQKLRIHILRAAPIYRDANQLVAWDTAYRSRWLGRDSKDAVDDMLDDIADLIGFNMYGAFDLGGTKLELDVVLKTLRNEGVPVTGLPSFDDM